MPTLPQTPIFVAIDTHDLAAATDLSAALAQAGLGLKFGLEFYGAHGPDGIARARPAQAPLFLDLKFHDIPATVAGAVRSAVARLQPDYLTVHASGGPAMLRAAVEAVAGSKTKILAVTVLTSLDDDDLQAVGQQGPANVQVARLGRMAVDAGVHGLVCAAPEIASLRAALGGEPVLMVPGIRPGWADANDQKRVLTPVEALQLGATHLVIGRPITAAPAPIEAARRILAEIAA